jgi:hypothetical protein
MVVQPPVDVILNSTAILDPTGLKPVQQCLCGEFS